MSNGENRWTHWLKINLTYISVIIGQLPAGNVLIFLPTVTVVGVGYRKVRVM